MIPLPVVIGEPFRRIAMEIVGPLPHTRRGNRFILVISDYATCYPKVVPLRSITAPKVAEVLVDLFSRHGVHEEILTDQGTNFTSALLRELYQIIRIKALRTSGTGTACFHMFYLPVEKSLKLPLGFHPSSYSMNAMFVGPWTYREKNGCRTQRLTKTF